MEIHWRPHHEVHPDLAPAPDFIAFDGEKSIGRVFQYEHSQDKGRWLWTMTVVLPGPRPDFATNGVEDRRGDAGRHVVEAYDRLLASREGGVIEARTQVKSSDQWG